MIAILRIIFLVPLIILVCVLGCLACICRPFHRNNTHMVAQMLSSLAPLFGIKMVVRVPADITDTPKLIIGNHQNTFDVVTISAGVRNGVVSIGKKSLKWVPFFGQLYWLSGNILIDRSNRTKAAGTISETAEKMRENNLSIWMFPEGTRSNGRGLLPFKTGAFHTAIQAQVPIVPIVMSSTGHFRLNRWDNGYAIVENLEPLITSGATKADVRELALLAHAKMQQKISELDLEVAQLNLNK